MVGKLATVVLCQPSGEISGMLPPIELSHGWWSNTAELIEKVRARDAIDITILRVLSFDGPDANSSDAATYLAQVEQPPPAGLPMPDLRIDTQPLRQLWAEPRGPEHDIAWATTQLQALGASILEPPQQMRSWHLSALWRLTTTIGRVWLKVVPSFFAHEGALLDQLRHPSVPELLAHDRGRALLAEIPGIDQQNPTVDLVVAMVQLVVDLQVDSIAKTGELLSLGLPDWRRHPLTEQSFAVFERLSGQLDAEHLVVLNRLFSTIDRRWDSIADAGIPDSLVHGDFHPGNFRWDCQRLVLLDWGDSGIGHPMLDQAAFMSQLDESGRIAAQLEWQRVWRDALPRADPTRAAGLLAPIGALRQALIYQRFEDNIEPTERLYHRGEAQRWLERAAALAGDSF